MHLGASCSLTKYSYSWWLMKTHVRNSIFLLKDLCLLHFFLEKRSPPLYFKKQSVTKVHEAWLTPYEGWDFISLKKLFGMKLCGFWSLCYCIVCATWNTSFVEPYVFDYLYVNHMNAPWLTKKKESIQYICALAHAAPLDGVEIPKAEHSPNLLEVVH